MAFLNKLLPLFIFFIFIHEKCNSLPAHPNTNNGPVCQSDFCHKIARGIINNMNDQINPCDDFYEYVCGNWHLENTVNEDKWGHFNIMVNKTAHRMKDIIEAKRSLTEGSALAKAKLFHRICTDTLTIERRGLTSLLDLINNFGGWPITLTYIENLISKKTWQDVDQSIRKLTGTSPIFVIKVLTDVKNSDYHIIQLSNVALSDPRYTLKTYQPTTLEDILTLPEYVRYKQSIINTAKLIGKNRGYVPIDEVLETEAYEIALFELKLKQISLVKVTPGIDSYLKKITINDLQSIYDLNSKNNKSQINWLNTIKDIFSDVHDANINGTEVITVIPVDYFLRLSELLSKTPPKVITNTIIWNLIKNYGVYANNEMRQILKSSQSTYLSTKKDQPRWKFCLAANEMIHAKAYEYVQNYFPDSSKKAATDMVHEVINQMRNQIESSQWLDDYSKAGAMRKINMMKEFIAFPDWYANRQAVDDLYKDLNLSSLFFENMLRLRKFSLTQMMKLLRQPVNKNTWVASPTDVNAFYYFPGNSLTIPAAIMQIPFFDHEQPAALNYGGIGTIIGHEISHGFDNIGSQYDESGNVRNWWSNITKNEYQKKAQCFLNKFHKYGITYNNTFHRVNALNTLPENIADSTGVRAAFEAFKIYTKENIDGNMRLPGLERFNSHQLFFLSYAHTFCGNTKLNAILHDLRSDSHCPSAFRIIGTLSNLESFADTFQCKNGTAMTKERCKIW